MRAFWTIAHRWIGLTTATFLFIAGATGAIISWDHELDGLLNPQLTNSASTGPALPALELAARVEARDPHARVTYLPLAAEPGETLSLFVQPRLDPSTGQLYELGYNQVFLDPVSGVERGRREWGAVWPITRATLVSFLYKLHYSLHVPKMWGEERWGLWIMGAVAGVWVLDCFVGFYLTLPPRHRNHPARPPVVARKLERGWLSRWAPAWKIKTSGSRYRVTFDMHRAFSLWTWALLLTIAFTAFSLNLYREVFYPVMSTVSKVTPTPFDTRTPAPVDRPIEPAVDFAGIVARAWTDAAARGWTSPIGAISYDQRYGIFRAMLFQPGQDDGVGGGGTPTLFYDGRDGRLLGEHMPWTGTAADLFVQAQFPLHSGRILGLPGRILTSLMGIVVATLSVTGLVIWWRKRAARIARAGRENGTRARSPAAIGRRWPSRQRGPDEGGAGKGVVEIAALRQSPSSDLR